MRSCSIREMLGRIPILGSLCSREATMSQPVPPLQPRFLDTTSYAYVYVMLLTSSRKSIRVGVYSSIVMPLISTLGNIGIASPQLICL